MSWLKRVIARLLGLPTQSMDNLAQQTQTVGLAHQELIQVRGNKRSAQATKRQPAQTAKKRKPKPAQSTTQGKSRKQEPSSAKPKATQRGKQQATLVSKTPQRAKSAPKRKP